MSWYKVTFTEDEFKENFNLIRYALLDLFERANFIAKELQYVGIFTSTDQKTKESTIYFTPDCVHYVPNLTSVFDLEPCEKPSSKGLKFAQGSEAAKSLLPDWDFS